MTSYMQKILDIKSPYQTNPPSFCYPGTVLMEEFGEIGKKLVPLHINSIGTHTFGITQKTCDVPSEGGFEIPHKMERDFIWWIASMFYKNILPQEVTDFIDGYFCGGGTEGNIEGLWIGREYLRSFSQDEVILVVTPLTHYSVMKGAHLLGIDKQLRFVKVNEKFEMDIDDLKKTIDEVSFHSKNILIVGTVGTTLCGSIDPICQINSLIRNYATKANFYFHIDASFGGFTVPFITEEILVGFENSEVKSIVVDADKMGLLPYPSGIFLCRKNLQNLVKIDVPYVGSHMDMTISGSRTFVSVACGWYYMKAYGVPWHRLMVEQCISFRDKLAEMLKRVKGVIVLPYSPYTNMLPITAEIDPQLMNPLYNLRSDEVEYQNKSIRVYKLCIFPHTFNHLDQFVSDLAEAIDKSKYSH